MCSTIVMVVENYDLKVKHWILINSFSKNTGGPEEFWPEFLRQKFTSLDHYWELSNEVLYNVLSQGASKLPEVENLDLYTKQKGTFLKFLTLTSHNKTLYITSFDRSQ